MEQWERLISTMQASRAPPAPRADPVDKTKRPSECWAGTADILMRLCQVTDEDDLPGLWHDWANSKEKLRRQVLQERLRRTATTMKLPCPIATDALVAVLFELAFASVHDGTLEKGLQPFLTVCLGESTAAEQMALNEASDLLKAGASSLADVLNVKAAGKVTVPVRDSQMMRTLRGFAVVS